MSICPKNKSSKGRRDKRRANWKMSAPTLVKCSKCGALMVPTEYARHAVLIIRKRSSVRIDHYTTNTTGYPVVFLYLFLFAFCLWVLYSIISLNRLYSFTVQ